MPPATDVRSKRPLISTAIACPSNQIFIPFFASVQQFAPHPYSLNNLMRDERVLKHELIDQLRRRNVSIIRRNSDVMHFYLMPRWLAAPLVCYMTQWCWFAAGCLVTFALFAK